ncbi:MAG: cadherin-like domain-containing protein [Sphingomonadaceae bacterium]|nr:cadherin-like domain-containing protein [Sphingomonadaceae bacterium]
MDFRNSDIANGLDVTSLIGADASASLEGAALLQMALQSGNIMPLTADGQLVLPAGVGLDDIKVVGRDLIIQMPDGTQMIVPDGAIAVPQIVVDGVAIPALNFAALLAGQEPQPAAGPPQSSGGNFADNVGDIGDPFALGDLLPPTQLAFPSPEEREVVPGLVDRDPDVIIQDGGPAGRDVIDNVNETGLPGTRANGSVESPGSAAGNGSDSTTGTIFVTAPDGVASITINGVVVTGAAGQQITTPFGVMTLNALSGDQIGYTYRLLDNTSGDTTADVFLVSLSDSDGDVASARLTINIADDVPTARNDIDSLIGGTFGPELGNVLTGTGTISGLAGADTPGADGAAISGFRAGASGSFAAIDSSISGQYGTLTLGANGSYNYVRNVNTPGGVADVFTYQLTDADGDASTATLTINIDDAPNRIPDIGDGTIGREPRLPARDSEPSGSQFDGNAEANGGTITFNSPDGVGNVTVAGAVLTPGALPQLVSSNATGSLLVTGYTYDPVTGIGSITYVYTLNDNTLNTNGETLNFSVVVTDLDGDVASDSLIVKIVDDAPLAANDSGTQQSENAPVSIDAFVNDTPGADGVNLATGVTVVAGSLTGAGALAYGNEGVFTYTPAPGEEGVVSFQYIITDGDGDTSTATVTISLLKDSLSSVEVRGENVVSEAGLPSGSDAASNSETTDGTIAIATGGDALASLVINNVNVTAGGTVTGASGILAISVAEGAYSYRYTLTDTTSGDATNDSFNVIVTDSDGDSANDTLLIAIQDDVPTARADIDNVTEGGSATGNVLTGVDTTSGVAGADTAGADGFTAGGGVVGVRAAGGDTTTAVLAGTGSAIAGLYGSLTLGANGSYNYVSTANAVTSNLPDVFVYTLRDADGDLSTTTLTLNVANVTVTATDTDALVDEAGLAVGSNPSATSEVFNGAITPAGGVGGYTYTLTTPTNGTYGNLVLNANGTYRYTLTSPFDTSPDANNSTNTEQDRDSFGYRVTDANGNTVTGTILVDIVDDVPMVTRSTAPVPTLTVDETALATDASLSFADVFTTNFGADGAGTTAYTLGVVAGPSGLVDSATGQAVNLFLNANIVEGRTAGSNAVVFSVSVAANGTVTLDQQRAVSHLPNAGPDQSTTLSADNLITLTATSTDGDGDTATATANIANALVFKDDGPAAIGESGTTSEILKDFNTAFVIDFSGSIDNTELNTQLVAVKAAINVLFDSTGGSVSVKFVLFASNAMASTTFTTAAAANIYLDSVNPATGGTRPSGVLGSTTDFSASIKTLLANYAADVTADNEVFFLSDGNPNENLGGSGQALNDNIRPLWNSFVNNNDINVTAIGVGNGINNSNLQQIDVDGAGAPILLANFDDLIDTLVALLTPTPITGDLDANDDYGSDGGRILSITVPTAAANDPVYSWNGVTGAGAQITASNGGPVINGTTSILVATEIGGQFGFNFATGQWSYTPPRNVPADRTEVFNYTIIDGDGDTATASLSVLVENNDLPATAAVTAIMDDDGSTGIVADAAFAKGGALSVVSRSADQMRTNNATTSIIAAALVGLAIAENAAAVPDGNLDQLGALISENPGIGNAVTSLAATGGASFASDLAFELTHDFAQRPHDVASSLSPSEEVDIARSFQDAPMAERSALLVDKADPVSDDQSNFAVAFGDGDQVMHSMLDITAFLASAGAGENAALLLPIEDALREAMPDLILDRLIDAFTADLGAPANDAGGGAHDSELLAGILSQSVDAFQLAALASNDLSGAHHYDMAMINHG